ncbi:MAG: hypothetical protein ACODAF_05465 [Actinomycetota bacterium]
MRFVAVLRYVAPGVVGVLGVLGVLGGAGCASGGAAAGTSSAEPSVTIRLVVPDANIREPGATCAGAGAYRYAHPEAPYAVEDTAGEPVATGVLPQGRAEKAWSMDMGDSRQPTVCVMMLEVPGLDSADGHSLAIGDRDPEPIEPNPNLDDIPEVVLP